MNKKKLALILLIALLSTTSLFALEVGQAAPTFSIKQLDGKTFNLSDYKNKQPVHLVFWATWCPSCTKEVPTLRSIYNKNKTSYKFLAINVGANDSVRRVKKYLKKHKIKYNVAFDKGSSVTNAYSIRGIPTQIIIDKNELLEKKSDQ